MADPIVVVGGGLAGGKTVEHLRDKGYDGPLVLVSAEPHRPYERPALSKAYLMGREERDTLFVHEEQWYVDHDVELMLDEPVTRLDGDARTVQTARGRELRFSRLLLATGAVPRRLALPGSDEDDRVRYLRTVEDSEQLRDAFRPGARVAVVGGGWIGLETASAAREAGAEVTLLEAAQLPLVRVVGTKVATLLTEAHRARGLDVRTGVTLIGLESGSSGVRLLVDDGPAVEADVVVVGIGVTPDVRLAKAAGLDVANGVVTDASLRTSHPQIWAAGDIANAYHPVLGVPVRSEHWSTALHQPAVVAAAMLGEQAVYDRQPYFFSDQGDLSLEYLGHVRPGGQEQVVVHGDLDKPSITALWHRDGRVVAGMVLNADGFDEVKALVRSGGSVEDWAGAGEDA